MVMRRWHGVVTIQGEQASSSDRRIFDSFSWREPPLTLRVQTEDFGGHSGASPVANIEGLLLLSDGRRVWGWGTFSESDPGDLAGQWVEEGVLRGISVDPGEYEYVEELLRSDGTVVDPSEFYRLLALADEARDAGNEDEYARIMEEVDELEWRIRFTSYEIAAATLVATPAFRDARIVITDNPATTVEAAEQVNLSAAAAAPSAPAPAASAADRVAALLGRSVSSSGVVTSTSVPRIGGGFAPDGVFVPPSPRLPAAARTAAVMQVMRAPWFDPDDEVAASRGPWSITPDGRMLGYLFSWSSCHRSFSGACVTPPREDDFPDFHVGQCHLDDGRLLTPADGTGVGVLTYADLHAGEGPRDPAVLRRLMEDTGTQIAALRLHADDYGVQACGQVYDGVDPADIARCLAGYPSGDWRDVGSGWHLYGLHVVNTPGHPYQAQDEHGRRMVASIGLPSAQAAGHSDCGCGGSCGGCGTGRPRLSAAKLADLAHLDAATAAWRR